MREFLATAVGRFALSAAVVVVLASVFFVLIGQSPSAMLWLIVQSAVGDGYALTETLVKATPILLCALATVVPARLGLITVGAEGQLYFGALIGTGFVLANLHGASPWLLIGAMLFAALAAALWSVVPGFLKAYLGVNETITTLLLNYVAALLVTSVVYGPWKNPASQGWPATVDFPDAAKPPTFFESRVHLGLWLAIGLAALLHWLLTRTRWGLTLDVLRSNARAGIAAGLKWRGNVLIAMALGGALAGIAGILETASIQGRLQANISAGAGFSGFLAAWLARNHCLRVVPMSVLVGALLASGDGLQMLANVPSSVSLVVQGLLFVSVLLVSGYATRWSARRG